MALNVRTFTKEVIRISHEVYANRSKPLITRKMEIIPVTLVSMAIVKKTRITSAGEDGEKVFPCTPLR
jgi:hypothetical protein